MKAKLTTNKVNSLTASDKTIEVWDTEIKGFFLLVTPKGAKTYYLFYRHNGAKRKYKIGRHGSNITNSQARDKAKKLAGKVTDGIDIQAERQNKRKIDKSHTLKTFIEQPYAEWRNANRKRSKDTINRLKTHFYPLFKNTKLKDITAWNVEKWKTARLKAGIKPTTVNRDVAELKSVLSKAVEWNEIEDHPLKKVKPAKIDQNPNVRYLSKGEEKCLRQSLSNRDKRIKMERANANEWRSVRGYKPYPDLFKQTYVDYLTPMVLLSINTGLRRGEIFHLQWEDINFSTKTLTI